VDISCDYSKLNNPIQLYSAATTWKKPVYKPSEHISIIAIENLPSLLPRESSIHFSKQLTRLLLENDEDIWQSNKNYFLRCLTDKKLN
jgi:saccharopine dehydrogenase (NAD+, L-lysine-forming)